MYKIYCKLTVLFEDPFWIGVFEKTDGEKLSVAKVTFGAEPKDYDFYKGVLKHYYNLKFSKSITAEVKEIKINPKRSLREAKKQVKVVGIGTKSQQALKLQQEQNKLERKVKSREQKQAEIDRLFELKQQKKKEKHKGR